MHSNLSSICSLLRMRKCSVVTQIIIVGLSIDHVFVFVMEPNQTCSHPASGIWSVHLCREV